MKQSFDATLNFFRVPNFVMIKARGLTPVPFVDEAADFYYLLMQKFSDHPAIQPLKEELGDKERQFEILARIRLISQFINDNDYLHGKALRN